MSLVRYQSPSLAAWPSFRSGSLRDDWDRLFEFAFPTRPLSGFSGTVPALDLYDTPEALIAKVEVPGVKNEDIDITLHEGVLTISGSRQSELESSNKTAFRSERTFGKFERSIALPTPVDASRVKASSKDGVLTVTLPKVEEAKPRKITVNVD